MPAPVATARNYNDPIDDVGEFSTSQKNGQVLKSNYFNLPEISFADKTKNLVEIEISDVNETATTVETTSARQKVRHRRRHVDYDSFSNNPRQQRRRYER